jgi:membrane protein
MKIRLPQNIQEQMKPRLQAVDRRTGGVASILLQAYHTFNELRAVEAAAAMTFYAVLSLFPLLALLVIVASLLIPHKSIASLLGNYLSPIFPVSRSFLDEVIARFVEVRAASGIIGALVLFWSASGVFVVLAHTINLAWENARRRNFIQGRLVAISSVATLMGLLVAALLSSLLIGFLSARAPYIINSFNPRAPLVALIVKLAPFALAFLAFFVAYRLLPTVPVRVSEAAWGALAVTVAWAVTSSLFGWYINRGAANFDTIFGPLAALVVLMLWMYINAILMVFGAHISAAVARRNLMRDRPRVKVG